jgi:hypothetical protein
MNIVEKYYKDFLMPTAKTMDQKTTIFEFDTTFVRYAAGPIVRDEDIYVTLLRNGRPIQDFEIETYPNGVLFLSELQIGDVVKIVYDAIRYGRK